MKQTQPDKLLEKLVKQPNESEWVEFKHNYHSDEEIGKNISALSNGACLHHQEYGYLVFGVEDKSHQIVGTNFKERFGIEDHNASIASRIIRDTLETGKIKDNDPETKSRKYARYIPFRA